MELDRLTAAVVSISIVQNAYYVIYKRPDGLTGSIANLTLGPEIGPLGHIIEIQIKVPQ